VQASFMSTSDKQTLLDEIDGYTGFPAE
jgi:hypothetical protein